jgi:hypothetical protein
LPALVKGPAVKVSVPLLANDSGLPSTTPPELFIVRFSNPEVTAGSVSALLPLQVIPEVEPPVNEPLAMEIEPFSVRVWAPIESAPLVNVSAPLTVPDAPRATPLLLLIVRFGTAAGEVGNSVPVVCAELP